MSWLSSIDWLEQLVLVNAVLTSGIVILSFALLIYILLYNLRNRVAQAFSVMFACVLVVYFADLAVSGAPPGEAERWLRLQWVGITLIPATYLHFTGALLVTTNDRNRNRSIAIVVAYALSGLMLIGATLTGLLVCGEVLVDGILHLQAGPLFGFFFVYFVVAISWGGLNVLHARQRCLTSTSRRRMTYLSLSFLAPALGISPYLLVTGWPYRIPALGLLVLLVAGNLAVGLLLAVMAYTVAFFGPLTSDRVVKHRFFRFLMRGPIQAIVVVVIAVLASRADGFLGLPALRLMLFGVVLSILVVQLIVELSKPIIDRLLYRRDKEEIAWLQDLSNRLLTTTDIQQFLENVLMAVCDLLRASTAFVAVTDGGAPRLTAVCGSLEPPPGFLPDGALTALAEGNPPRYLQQYGSIFCWDGYWLIPLRSRSSEDVVGILGVTARATPPNLSEEETAGLTALTVQIETVLEDQRIQESLFTALAHLIPQIEDIQLRRSLVRYEGNPALQELTSTIDNPDFNRWVRDALSHYWGGPKLTLSPLLNLRVVERASVNHANPINALRDVLQVAIEGLRPEGDRSLTAAEWLLYNILELKFIRGLKVRDVAMRLAMSESDLYRKQRIAIEEVAHILAEMEREEQRNDDPCETQVLSTW